jgi:hypothetical protein
LIAQYEEDKKPIQREAQVKIRKLSRQLIQSLKPLQDKYTKDAKLDEAVTIRDWIRYLQNFTSNILQDPGTLNGLNPKIGDVLHIRVTGGTSGALWGTDVYTTDSSLAMAAVHAGVLKAGETGIIKVTILPGQESYQGSMRNGISSNSWQSFPASFKVERGNDRLEEDENQAPDSSVESETTQRDTSLETRSLQTMGRNYNRVRPGF